LFLFKIHNKDWNKYHKGSAKTGAKNLHTLYWEQVFSEENKQRNFTFKLNGGAELFFRPKTPEEKLEKVTLENGKQLIRNKRYLKDTVLFHCPIDINRTAGDKTSKQFNTEVLEFLADNPDINIIGVDRGEKHLAYYSIITQAEKILEVGTLNVIGEANGKAIDYAEKLARRAQEREAARREWKDIEAIKNMKQGYISQVVNKLANLMVEHNAIIVFEDLNMRFKQVRGGIEKSVYQQLEKALIDKLNFIVKKDETDPQKAGHLLRAYQLSAPISAFKDMGKQTGFMFYTQAEYTSKTCPQCGFRRNIKAKFANIDQAKAWFGTLNNFEYDASSDAFLIYYTRSNFLNKQQTKPKKIANELLIDKKAKDRFVISTKDAIRYKWVDKSSPLAKSNKNGVSDFAGEEMKAQFRRGVVKRFNLTECIKRMFEENDVNYQAQNLQQIIASSDKSKAFYQDLLYYIFLLGEIRQAISGQPVDYIHCPCCLYDSRNGLQGFEFDSDANGAYNIARKGKLILDKINKFKSEKDNLSKMGWSDLNISIDEWDKFTQK
jgi:transposase